MIGNKFRVRRENDNWVVYRSTTDKAVKKCKTRKEARACARVKNDK